MSLSKLTVRDLRRNWKPTKTRLARAAKDHPLAVRMHRAFSWLAAAEERDAACPDSALIFRWISLNALYGTWNGREPNPDYESLRRFLKQIFEWDANSGVLGGELTLQSERILRIFGNRFLNDYYWRTLESGKTFSVARNVSRAQTELREQNWPKLTDDILGCIYLLRCQLIHGAATFQSDLNREAITESSALLDAILKAILTVMTTHGLKGSWDNLCYPPK